MPKTRVYDQSKLELAIRDVQNKVLSYKKAELKYGILRSTIEFKIKNTGHKISFESSPILSKEEEDLLVNWIKDNARKGFRKKANDLKSSVQKFLCSNPRNNPFKNNRLGDGWIKAFLKRHLDISNGTFHVMSVFQTDKVYTS